MSVVVEEEFFFFSQTTAQLLLDVEELRLMTLSSTTAAPWRIEEVLPRVEDLLRLFQQLHDMTCLLEKEDDPQRDIRQHCHDKLQTVLQQILTHALTVNESSSLPPDDGKDDLDPVQHQAAVARLVHMTLMVVLMENTSSSPSPLQADDILEQYAQYQRQILRQRVTPAIAQLVQVRRRRRSQTDNNEETTQQQQQYATVLATILGQAAALIHPLLAWHAHLTIIPSTGSETEDDDGTTNHGHHHHHHHHHRVNEALQQLCQQAVHTLHDQATQLSKTVSEWFWQDRPIHNNNDHPTNNKNNNSSDHPSSIADGQVEELAFGCQVLARYQHLLSTTPLPTPIDTTTIQTLLTEWTWKYAELERQWVLVQLKAAWHMASCVPIVIGTNIQLSSVVEDAHYLSTRALERAASTLSVQAIGTVAHALSRDVWGATTDRTAMTTTTTPGGVYKALVERRGCFAVNQPVPENQQQQQSPARTKSNDFAAALLDALDEDLGPTITARPTASAPTSGNSLLFVTNIVTDQEQLLQRDLDADFCTMNGIHAASGACRSLVVFLDSLLEDERSNVDTKAMAMIQLAREDLSNSADAYQQFLQTSIQETIATYCGAVEKSVGYSRNALCFEKLRFFLEQENYNHDEKSIVAAESDERLDQALIEPFRESRMLSQLSDKCEPDVLRHLGDALILSLVDLISSVLWTTEKRFTDWGSLLLAKQVRWIQSHISTILTPENKVTAPILQPWERLSQILTVLQLEKPSDWLAYNQSSVLVAEELQATMRLRIDFSPDAIQAVVSQVASKKEPGYLRQVDSRH